MSSWPVECLVLRFMMIASISVCVIVVKEKGGALCCRKYVFVTAVVGGIFDAMVCPMVVKKLLRQFAISLGALCVVLLLVS